MDNTRNSHDRTRRKFLQRVATTGGMVAFAAQAPGLMAQPATGEKRQVLPLGDGYRETEHIRKYYETARR